MHLFSTLLFLLVPAHADSPAYLKDFNYSITEVASLAQAQALENRLNLDTREASICSNRAHLWAYELYKFQGIQTGKVFLHFTELGEPDENKAWAYHVAPYVIVGGEEYVLDPFFPEFLRRPIKLSAWTQHFTKNPKCVVLDPIHSPEHLKLEKNNIGSDDRTPLDEKTGNARQYPVTFGSCYLRKVPMYFQWPYEVYGSDLLKAGDARYSDFRFEEFEEASVLQACKQALKWGTQMKRSCSAHLGIR